MEKKEAPANGTKKEETATNTQLTNSSITDKEQPKLLKPIYTPSASEDDAAKVGNVTQPNKNTANPNLENAIPCMRNKQGGSTIKPQNDIEPENINNPDTVIEEKEHIRSTCTPSLSSRISTAISNFVDKTLRPKSKRNAPMPIRYR